MTEHVEVLNNSNEIGVQLLDTQNEVKNDEVTLQSLMIVIKVSPL